VRALSASTLASSWPIYLSRSIAPPRPSPHSAAWRCTTLLNGCRDAAWSSALRWLRLSPLPRLRERPDRAATGPGAAHASLRPGVASSRGTRPTLARDQAGAVRTRARRPFVLRLCAFARALRGSADRRRREIHDEDRGVSRCRGAVSARPRARRLAGVAVAGRLRADVRAGALSGRPARTPRALRVLRGVSALDTDGRRIAHPSAAFTSLWWSPSLRRPPREILAARGGNRVDNSVQVGGRYIGFGISPVSSSPTRRPTVTSRSGGTTAGRC
jgi:hypothetical protein